MPYARGSFFVKPTFFNVDHAINPHMLDESGKPNQINFDVAQKQWKALVSTYESLGLEIQIFEPLKECPDMVFCANQSLPYLNKDGKPAALMSNMQDDCRQEEVASIESSLKNLGFEISYLPERTKDTLLEGMGDALWVPGKKIICGGYGFRTHESIYSLVSERLDASVVTFELKNPRFYHLDTCLSILDDKHVIACKEAFQDDDWKNLCTLFENVIEVPLSEADSPYFACNAHCPDRKHVILQEGSVKTEAGLKEYGFTPIPLNTAEFIKSGGSVFCMKQMYF